MPLEEGRNQVTNTLESSKRQSATRYVKTQTQLNVGSGYYYMIKATTKQKVIKECKMF